MKLSGLARQWQTRDQLFAAFADHEETLSLLQCLENMDGPDLWVGSSHRFLRFLAQDSGLWPDEIPPLAYACALGDGYRIEYPCPREVWLWPDSNITVEVVGVEKAAGRLLTAIRHSGNNPNRPGAACRWYVCPWCDFYAPMYSAACWRCGELFPAESECGQLGILRSPPVPLGAVVPTRSGTVWM